MATGVAKVREGRLPALTVTIVPASAFSGRPPSAGGLKRGSRRCQSAPSMARALLISHRGRELYLAVRAVEQTFKAAARR